jgi:hypothetical protein
MSHRPNVPKNMEIWTGSPKGLRLRKHPRLKDALGYLYEASMVIRKPAPIGRTQLTINSKLQIRWDRCRPLSTAVSAKRYI